MHEQGLAERRYYRTMSADSATYRGEGSADGCFALRQAPSVRRVLRAWIRLVQSRPVVPILHGHADVGNDHRPHSGIGLQHRVGGFRRPHGSGHRRAGPAWSAAQAIHASDRALVGAGGHRGVVVQRRSLVRRSSSLADGACFRAGNRHGHAHVGLGRNHDGNGAHHQHEDAGLVDAAGRRGHFGLAEQPFAGHASLRRCDASGERTALSTRERHSGQRACQRQDDGRRRGGGGCGAEEGSNLPATVPSGIRVHRGRPAVAAGARMRRGHHQRIHGGAALRLRRLVFGIGDGHRRSLDGVLRHGVRLSEDVQPPAPIARSSPCSPAC